MVTVPDKAMLGGNERYFLSDQGFFTKYAAILALIIIFGFAQFAARGIVDIPSAPVWVHMHGAIMLLWLGLFVGQNLLIQRKAFASHRKLGWFSLLVAMAIVVVTCYSGYMAVALGRKPPVFSDSYFLALVYVEALVFLSMVIWAITRRRDTQWHRRLMFGSTIIILEPAFGRLLPLPLLVDWAEWIIMLVQLGFVAVLARHDRQSLGRIHPATSATMVIVIAVHVAVEALALFPPLVSFAETVAAAG